ncbi:MAG: hypothetical protein DRQ13_04940, partial [Ignavibacteriae bacterium]
LPSHINQHLARYPAISPNGKRLFFNWFWPTWNLYYSDWDSTINNWGPAINCGPYVNDPYAGGCVLPNDTTLIFLRDTETHISYWNSLTETWGPAERWPTPTLWFQSDWGIYVSPNFKKVYYEGARADTTISGQWYLNYDSIIRYQDTTSPSGYGPRHILNFCLYADTQYFAGNYVDRFEGFPTLTPDGKKMYLTATYQGQTTIYESIMLIDENGNPVKVEEENVGLVPESIELLPPYPNPFNPVTKIKYVIASGTKQSELTTLKVFDVLGKEVTTLVNEQKQAGEYEITFDASKLNLASGTYIIVLKTAGAFLTRKVLLIK